MCLSLSFLKSIPTDMADFTDLTDLSDMTSTSALVFLLVCNSSIDTLIHDMEMVWRHDHTEILSI